MTQIHILFPKMGNIVYYWESVFWCKITLNNL